MNWGCMSSVSHLERSCTNVPIGGRQLKLICDLVRDLLRSILVSIICKVYCAPMPATWQQSHAQQTSLSSATKPCGRPGLAPTHTSIRTAVTPPTDKTPEHNFCDTQNSHASSHAHVMLAQCANMEGHAVKAAGASVTPSKEQDIL
jgi:hypothetical protein